MTPPLALTLISMAKVEPNLGSRVKFGGFLKLGIHWRVSYPFLLFVMCTRRRRIPSVAKRIHNIPTMKDPQLPVFALTLNSMEDLDQRCDRRVESDPLTLIPMEAYQTSGRVGSVGDGRLRMRRPARLTLHRVYKLCRKYQTPGGVGSVGDAHVSWPLVSTLYVRLR